MRRSRRTAASSDAISPFTEAIRFVRQVSARKYHFAAVIGSESRMTYPKVRHVEA